MHPKIARDPYYRALYEWGGLGPVLQAGWFEDKLEHPPYYNLQWLCTSLSKVRANLSGATNPAVLITTGGMAPVHKGHLAIMEAAKTSVEAAGFDVVGGFIAPDHDEYMRFKLGDGFIPAPLRCNRVAKATAKSDWLTVDPWAAIHQTTSLNFTDLIERLRLYIRQHLKQDIPVFYVCGGDNARFALAFFRYGHCCVINRPEHEETAARFRQDDRIKDNPHIIWGSNTVRASSTEIRAGDLSMLPEGTENLDYQLPDNIFIRVEDSRVVLDPDRWESVSKAIPEIFIQTFQGQVYTTPIHSQLARAKHLTVGGAAISLDGLLPLDQTLAVSRLFSLGGYDHQGYVNRPGSLPLEQQVKRIPAGDYTLFDDDVATGGTMAFIEALCEGSGVNIIHRAWLTDCADEQTTKEIVDLRDFVVGTKNGGLVIELPTGEVARVPYIYPFVDPTARASVPPDQAMAFSAAIWQVNERIYKHSGYRVSNLPPEAQAPFIRSGFNGGSRLHQVCKHFRIECASLATHLD